MNSTHYSSYDLERQRQRLEALVQPQPTSPVVKALQRMGHTLVRFLTNGHNPHIQQRWQNGCLFWWVYDPMTQQTQRFYSEDELRIWLEGRYYE
jgi:hypothetical protein